MANGITAALEAYIRNKPDRRSKFRHLYETNADRLRRKRPKGFDYPSVSDEHMKHVWGVIDGLDAANASLRMALRMLEVTHNMFPYPSPGYRRVRKTLNAAVKELKTHYPRRACYTCILDGYDPMACTECEGTGYLTRHGASSSSG